MTDDDLQRRLEALGRSETPAVDGAFADRLEADLRVMAAESAPGSLFGWLLRPAVVVAAVGILAGVAFLLARPEGSQLEFAAAEGTSVSIPGRAELADGRAGQSIPDGTRITVGPEGSATVGGIVLEPGTIAIVVNGVVEVVELPATTETPPPTEPPPTTTEAPATTDAAVAPTTTPIDDDTTTAAPATTPSTTAAPSTTDGERTTTTVTDRSTTSTTNAPPSTEPPLTTTTAPPTTTTVADAPPTPERPTVTLTISLGPGGRGLLEWTVEGDASDIAGWHVRRGRGENAEVIAVLRRPEARRQRIDLPDRNVAWSVVARDVDGQFVAASNFVRPG